MGSLHSDRIVGIDRTNGTTGFGMKFHLGASVDESPMVSLATGKTIVDAAVNAASLAAFETALSGISSTMAAWLSQYPDADRAQFWRATQDCRALS